MNKISLCVVLDNIRSAQNVGSILRTCDGLDVSIVHACGITPYPRQINDSRLPHIIEKNERQIMKTALGAEKTVKCLHSDTLSECITQLKKSGWQVVGVEQSKNSIPINEFTPTKPTALVFGNEVKGINLSTLMQLDQTIELPMLGQKNSLNVSVMAGVALYQCRYGSISNR